MRKGEGEPFASVAVVVVAVVVASVAARVRVVDVVVVVAAAAALRAAKPRGKALWVRTLVAVEMGKRKMGARLFLACVCASPLAELAGEPVVDGVAVVAGVDVGARVGVFAHQPIGSRFDAVDLSASPKT